MDYAKRAENYRHKAEEIHALCEAMSNPFAKRKMRAMAADYLQMADTVDALAATKRTATAIKTWNAQSV